MGLRRRLYDVVLIMCVQRRACTINAHLIFCLENTHWKQNHLQANLKNFCKLELKFSKPELVTKPLEPRASIDKRARLRHLQFLALGERETNREWVRDLGPEGEMTKREGTDGATTQKDTNGREKFRRQSRKVKVEDNRLFLI